jgi:hypothetical protein
MSVDKRDWKDGKTKASTNGKDESFDSSATEDFDDNPDPVLAGKLLTRSDLRNLPDPEPLIDNVLDQGTTAYLYGKWGTAKSFVALDWAACVACGKPWQGRETQQRRVLYVAGEGAFGFKGRVDAWETGWRHNISDDWLAILPVPVNLSNVAEVNNLLALIEWGGYSFVILDTLSRCMVGADENSAKDCGEVVDVMRRLLAATPGGRGVVLGVHHAGKDGQTFRGSTVFEGAADTVYFTSRDEDSPVIDLNREKRKDGAEHDHHLLEIDLMPGTNSAVLKASQSSGSLENEAEGQKPVNCAVTTAQLADIVYEVIAAQPDRSVESRQKLFAAMRMAEQLSGSRIGHCRLCRFGGNCSRRGLVSLRRC